MPTSIPAICTAAVHLVFLSCYTANAQSKIRGSVMDVNGKPLAFANVLLLSSADSALIKGTITNDAGVYYFDKIAIGKYIITSSHAGFEQGYISSFHVARNNDDIDAATLTLSSKAAELNKVTVTAKKPLYEHKIDRLIINVENSITSAGSTALEVLERSPGVVVDHQNNIISMNGKDGVVVMINGKMNYMPAAAIVQMLSGMNAANIEKIELITTPPANFDAQGNAGYINIVFKANNNFGTNGSFSGTLGYQKGSVWGAGVNFNHRKGKINVYGDLSFSRLRKPFPNIFYNKISYQGNITETYFNGDRIDTTRNFNGRVGMDYQLNNRTLIGILLSGYDNKYSQSESNEHLIIKNNQLDTVLKLSNFEINHWKNASSNINMQHHFREGEQLSVNLDYIYYTNNQPFNYFTSYYDGSGNFLYDERKRSGKSTPISFWITAIDYSKKIRKKISMEAGIKKTIAAFNNDLSLERFEQNSWITDTPLSVKYKLDENYAAAYASFNIAIDSKTDVKIGLRYEYTNSNLGTTDVKNIVDRHYGNLFPNFFMSRKLNEDNAINISYGMRITRPTFNNLAPFIYYVNSNTLITGNPALQASISNIIKADYTFKRYLFSVSLSKEDHAIARFQPRTDPASNKIIYSSENLINQKTASAIISIPVNVNNWWSMQYNATAVYKQVNALYKDEQVRISQFNFHIDANQSFKLPKMFSIELSGFYQSKDLAGIFTQKAYGSLDAGLKKKLLQGKSSFTFAANNILNTLKLNVYADLPEYDLVTNFNVQFAHPTFKLTYSCSFGNEKLKGKRERATGAEEEKNRVQ